VDGGRVMQVDIRECFSNSFSGLLRVVVGNGAVYVMNHCIWKHVQKETKKSKWGKSNCNSQGI